MKAKLFSVMALFAVVMIAITAVFYGSTSTENTESLQSAQIVALNEIEQLANAGETELLDEKISDLQQSIRGADIEQKNNNSILIMCGVSILFLIAIFAYIYFAVLRPFDKLKAFTENISKGNFDIPLNYERSNYFGKFTWAFDSMRREITKARSCEKEAIENNKTVIATLSHDIKTPIASIRAYAEGLQANIASTPEKRERYLSVLMRKCDEVSKLTNDLFLHSLSDLDKLKINSEEFELCSFIGNIVSEIAGEQNDINFTKPDFTAVVCADKNRITQITENLINNARKYAKTDIDIKLTQSDGYINIHFRDCGNGIPDKDMPFIFDKFYRGKNCENEQGSGLGLYIVKYLTEKMNGKVLLHNHKNGLEAVVSIPVANT